MKTCAIYWRCPRRTPLFVLGPLEPTAHIFF
jgi:hypothetical protein